MNVLLIGGSGSLMDGLILKLRKEGHRVFLLTGDKYKRNNYAKVFERYDFSYDSENLREILESVNPDVTIFMGAFDSNFRWKEEEREAVRYTSSLMNILVAYASIGHGRFILLSSDEVYNGNYEEAITEEVPTRAGNVRGTTIIQAEDICENFRKNRNLDMLILRLDHLFSIPKKLKDIQNICAQMCLESLRDGSITAGLNHEFSMIYEKDAIEFIYQAVWKKQHRENVYHLSSGQKVTEVELAGMIQKILGTGSNVVAVSDTNGRCILSGQKFETEYGVHSFFDLEEAVQKIVTYMQKHKEVFVNGLEEKLPWWKRLFYRWKWLITAIIPFVENLICFVPFFMMNNRTVGSEYFANLDPYLLYVLLFAIVYGQQQATFSAICAVAGYLFRQMYNRTGFEVVLDYNTYVWIAQLFILGLVVGYMRDQIRTMRKESEELEEHLTRQIADIRDINESNVRVKNVMEHQLITHKDSIGKIYSITSQLDRQVPDEVMFDAVQMMKELMNTDDIAIYNVVNHDYARMFSASSEKARSLGNSIRYREMTELFQELEEGRVYINKSMNAQYPLMANAISEGGEIRMIIMVWGLGWERMTLGQANFLTVVSYLIQNAVLRARRYMEALKEKRYMKDSDIMEIDAFQTLVHSYMNAQERNLTQCVLLRVDVPKKAYGQVSQNMRRKLRDSDYFGIMGDEELYVLLSNTTVGDAVFVERRFQENGYDTSVVETAI